MAWVVIVSAMVSTLVTLVLLAAYEIWTRRDRSQPEEPEPQEEAALPVDPNNPPTWKVYKGPSGRHRCHCHGQPVNNRDEVLWWETKGEQDQTVVYLFCRTWMQEQRAKGQV